MTTQEVKDLKGQQIEVGDEIAYSLRAGDNAALGVYRVLDITETGVVKAKQMLHSNGDAWVSRRLSTLTMPASRAVITKKWSDTQ